MYLLYFGWKTLPVPNLAVNWRKQIIVKTEIPLGHPYLFLSPSCPFICQFEILTNLPLHFTMKLGFDRSKSLSRQRDCSSKCLRSCSCRLLQCFFVDFSSRRRLEEFRDQNFHTKIGKFLLVNLVFFTLQTVAMTSSFLLSFINWLWSICYYDGLYWV